MSVIGDLRRMRLGGMEGRCWGELIRVGLHDEFPFELERGDLAVDVDLPLVVLV